MVDIKCDYVDSFLRKLDVEQMRKYESLKKDLLLHLVEDISPGEWFELIIFMSKKYPEKFELSGFKNLIEATER